MSIFVCKALQPPCSVFICESFLPWWMLRLLKATPGSHRDLFPFSFIKTCKIGQGRRNMRTFLSERRCTGLCRGTPKVLLYYSKNSFYLALAFHSQHPADCSSTSVVFKNSTEFHGLRMLSFTICDKKNTLKHHLYK